MNREQIEWFAGFVAHEQLRDRAFSVKKFAPRTSLDDVRRLENYIRKLDEESDDGELVIRYAMEIASITARAANSFEDRECDALYASPEQRCDALMAILYSTPTPSEASDE